MLLRRAPTPAMHIAVDAGVGQDLFLDHPARAWKNLNPWSDFSKTTRTITEK